MKVRIQFILDNDTQLLNMVNHFMSMYIQLLQYFVNAYAL